MQFNTPYSHLPGTYVALQPRPYDALDRFAHPDPAFSLSYVSFLPDPSDSYAALDPDGAGYAPHLDALTEGLGTDRSRDPLSSFFTGKRQFLAKTVEDVLTSIYERESLKDENLRRIDYESAQQKSRLFELDEWRTGVDPGIDKTRGNIERDLIAFEREKRFEQVACWRDVTRLKGELRDALREFTQEQRKLRLLGTYEV